MNDFYLHEFLYVDCDTLIAMSVSQPYLHGSWKIVSVLV